MKRIYPNSVPIVGSRNIAFYNLDRQSYTLHLKESIYKDSNAGNEAFSLEQVSEAGLDILSNIGLLISDPVVSNNKGLQTIQDYEWHSPSIITNATVEISEQNGLIKPDNFLLLLDILSKIICKHLFIRVIEVMSITDIAILVNKIESTNAHSLQLVLPFDEDYYSNEFGEIIVGQQKISYVIVENSPFDKNIEDKIFFSSRALMLGYDKIESHFFVNHSLFEESQKHHTYFNRKLHISQSGEIKNALETNVVFGYIQEITNVNQLVNIINTPAFQYYWFVHKNICEVCQDCEYKHMCVDNRVPIYREDGSWYHTQMCNYNPYTGKWS